MKKKASILIIVLYIMFLSALWSILVTKYINNMLTYSWELAKYYKAYYHAYWGVEIELTKASNHGFWFDDRISKDSSTVLANITECPENMCHLETEVIANTKTLSDNNKNYLQTDCSEDTAIELKQWQGVIVPLFWDINNWSDWEWSLWSVWTNKLTSSNYNQIKIWVYWWQNERLTIWITDEENSSSNPVKVDILSDIYEIDMNETRFNTLNYNDSINSFLIIANIESIFSTQKVCIQSPVSIPSWYITIKSEWRYLDKYVSIEAIKQNKLPEYLIYNIIK